MIGAAFHHRWVRWVALALVLIRLWLVTAQPVVVIAGAGLDDRLFVSMADRIVSGHWLGDYDQFTLAKGAGYPLFIALSFLLGIPLPLAEQGLYLLACWLLVRALRPLLRNDGWSLLLFAGLIWQPMSYLMPEIWGGSVLRQNLYTPLTVLLFAGLVALHTRRHASATVRLGWALLLGVGAGWFWITREEGIWILPSAAVLLAASACVIWREKSSWIASLWPPLAALGFMTLAVASVCAVNAQRYGWFGECEFHAPEFAEAYGALTRIRVGPVKLRFPVTQAMRFAAYEASPTFAELRPTIEQRMTERWAGKGTEFNGGMWMWALRDAVRESGHAPNPTAALEFYRRVAQEVNAACDSGRVPAGPSRSSFLPPWTPAHTAEAKVAFWPYARRFVAWEGFRARPPASQSHGIPSLMSIFHDMTQWPLSPSADEPARDTPRTKAWRAWRIGALQSIGDTLRWPIVGATGIAFLLWGWSLGRSLLNRRLPDFLWWVAASALGGAVVVWTIAFLVHVTSWGDMRPLRFAQGYPLLILFAGAAIVDALARPAKPAVSAPAAVAVG